MRAQLVALALVSALASCGGHEATPADTEHDPGRCVTCHLSDYRGARKHEGVKPRTCASCHVETGWHPTHLVHSWPLTGAHEKAACFACHVGEPPVYVHTSKLCVDCHQKAQIRANAELAAHTRFSSRCEECHSTLAWKPTLPHETAKPATTPPSAAPSASASERPAPKPVPKPVPKPTPKPVPTRAPDVVTQPSR